MLGRILKSSTPSLIFAVMGTVRLYTCLGTRNGENWIMSHISVPKHGYNYLFGR